MASIKIAVPSDGDFIGLREVHESAWLRFKRHGFVVVEVDDEGKISEGVQPDDGDGTEAGEPEPVAAKKSSKKRKPAVEPLDLE